MERRRNSKINRRIVISKVVLILFALLVVGSCRSSKRLASSGAFSNVTAAALVDELNSNSKEFDTFRYSKIKYIIKQNGSKNSFSGMMSIKSDEEIFATVTAFLGIEVARVLFTKESVKIKSNFEKKLYVLDYNQLASKYGVSTSFSALQDMLTYNFSFYKYNLYDYQMLNNKMNIVPKAKIASKVLYDKYIISDRSDEPYLTNVEVCAQQVNDCLKVNYDDFRTVGDQQKPFFIRFNNSDETLMVEMAIQRAELNPTVKHSLGNLSGFKTIQINDIP